MHKKQEKYLTLITKHISNHVIKNNQYFVFLIWILFFNIFINIILYDYVSI